MLKIKCPKCGTPLEVPDDKAQGKGRCSACETKFLIPSTEEDEIEIIEEEKTRIENEEKGKSSKDKADTESGKGESADKGESVGKDESDNEPLSEDFVTRWLRVLGLISLGLVIGILVGFYVGRFTATPEDDFYQSKSPVKSRGDTLDPFGIGNN